MEEIPLKTSITFEAQLITVSSVDNMKQIKDIILRNVKIVEKGGQCKLILSIIYRA